MEREYRIIAFIASELGAWSLIMTHGLCTATAKGDLAPCRSSATKFSRKTSLAHLLDIWPSRPSVAGANFETEAGGGAVLPDRRATRFDERKISGSERGRASDARKWVEIRLGVRKVEYVLTQ